MAARTTKTRHTFIHHVAPFAPLALALAINAGGGKPTTTTTTPPKPSGHAVAFAPSCSAPHFPGAHATAMDETSCGLSGNGGAETAQNDAKNNFCAADPARPVNITDMIALQQKVQ